MSLAPKPGLGPRNTPFSLSASSSLGGFVDVNRVSQGQGRGRVESWDVKGENWILAFEISLFLIR